MRTTKHRSKQHQQWGLSLIELLITLALGMSLLVGLSLVFLAVKQTFRFQETTGRLQEDGTFALDSIAKNLRMAGYAGCTGINRTAAGAYFPANLTPLISSNRIEGSNPLAVIEPTNLDVTTQPYTPYNFIRGFDSVPSGMFATGTVPVTGATNSIFFANGSAKAVGLSSLMSTRSSPLTLATDPYQWRNATANSGIYDMVVSNCDHSFVFKGKVTASGSLSTASVAHSAADNTSTEFTTASTTTTSVNNVSVNTVTTTPESTTSGSAITGSTTTDSTATTVSTPTGPTTTVVTTTVTRTRFGTDAIVMPAEWSFYYVATRTDAKTPSLYRVFFNGNQRGEPEELVSNVESMRLHYGEANNATTHVPDVWRTCAAGPASATCDPVIDWSRVVAVRIGLMMISAEDNASPGVVLAAPTLLGFPYSIPSGASTNRLRKEFSTTVVIRNRVKWQ